MVVCLFFNRLYKIDLFNAHSIRGLVSCASLLCFTKMRCAFSEVEIIHFRAGTVTSSPQAPELSFTGSDAGLGSFVPALLLTDSCGRCSRKSRSSSSACCCCRSDTPTDARGRRSASPAQNIQPNALEGGTVCGYCNLAGKWETDPLGHLCLLLPAYSNIFTCGTLTPIFRNIRVVSQSVR